MIGIDRRKRREVKLTNYYKEIEESRKNMSIH